MGGPDREATGCMGKLSGPVKAARDAMGWTGQGWAGLGASTGDRPLQAPCKDQGHACEWGLIHGFAKAHCGTVQSVRSGTADGDAVLPE